MPKLLGIGICLLLLVGSQQISGLKNIHDDHEHRDKRDISVHFTKENALRIIDIVAKLPDFKSKAVALWEVYGVVHDFFAETPKYKKIDTEERIKMLDAKVDKLAADVKDFKNRLFTKLLDQFDAQTLETKLGNVAKKMETINNNYYSKFLRYTKEPNQEYYLLQLAEDVTKPLGLATPLGEMKTELLERTVNYRNILFFLADPRLVKELMCRREQSAQQNIYVLYEKVLLTEIRAYLMLVFSTELINKLHNQGTSTEVFKKEFLERMNNIFRQVKQAMSVASREIWNCDQNFIEGTTYGKIRPIFQKFVLHESEGRNLPSTNGELVLHLPSWHFGCDQECKDMKGKKQNKCIHGLCHYAEHKQCEGTLRDCEFKHDTMTVCYSYDSYRKYEYIVGDSEHVYGVKNKCPYGESTNTWWRLWDSFERCDYCLCTCDSSMTKKLGVSINLRPVLSQIDQNKVVTGVQIVNGEMIHLQITEGQLIRGAGIQVNTTNIQPIEHYSIYNESYREDIDYTQITWERRKICLDDLDSSKKDEVMTGLKFELDEKKRVQLAIRLTKFNFNTGVLQPKSSRWLSQRNLPSKTREPEDITMKDLDIPRGNDYNEPRYPPGQCIEFQTSGLKQDAGQNVVPFIDIQPLTPHPPMPMSGAGIFLRGSKETGGFIVPKLFSFNVEPYMHEPKIEQS